MGVGVVWGVVSSGFSQLVVIIGGVRECAAASQEIDCTRSLPNRVRGNRVCASRPWTTFPTALLQVNRLTAACDFATLPFSSHLPLNNTHSPIVYSNPHIVHNGYRSQEADQQGQWPGDQRRRPRHWCGPHWSRCCEASQSDCMPLNNLYVS